MAMSKQETEVESKLLIMDPDPASFLRQISRKSHLSIYRLIKQGRLLIRDVYLDTPEAALKNQRLALRLRKQNENYFLTLKGKTEISDWGGVKRLEIELPWSLNSYLRIINLLKENAILIDSFPKNISITSPLDILKNPSFTIVQDRETRRLIRKVMSANQQQKVLAELALDTVTYHLADLTVLQAEIELEAKDVAGLNTVRELTEYLIQEYPKRLRSWTISKLSTGILIGQLHQEENIQKFVNRQNYLLPLAFDRIAKKVNSIQE
jgi:inorganic triphosphatase YgiF